MSGVVVSDRDNDLAVDDLRQEIQKLRQELGFERQLIHILENIRSTSKVLINACRCNQTGHFARLQNYHKFNTVYDGLKSSPDGSALRLHQSLNSGVLDPLLNQSNAIDTDISATNDNNDNTNHTDDDNHHNLNSEDRENEENVDEEVSESPNSPPQSTCTPYTCYACDQDFDTQSELDVHTESVHLNGDESFVDDTTYQCDKCYQLFDTEDQLVRHWRLKHRQKRLFDCDQCPYKTLAEKYLLRHKQNNHTTGSPRRVRPMRRAVTLRKGSPLRSPLRKGSPLRIPLRKGSPLRSPRISPRVISNAALLENNLLQSTPKKAKKSINDLSPSKRSFSDESSTNGSPKRRSQRSTARLTIEKNFRLITELMQFTDNTNANTTPNPNSKAVKTLKSFSAPMTVHLPPMTPSAKRIASNTSLGIGMSDGKRDYRCTHCRCLFPTELKLLNHLSYKHGMLSFVCHMCGYKTSKKFYLERHMSIHTDAKPFQCDECDKFFKTRGILLTHKRQTHSPLKRFSCDLCDYKTSNKNSLTTHRSRHSTQKPFRCDVDDCGKYFKTSICLYQHKNVVHSSDRFECIYPECSRVYHCKKALQQHIAIHEVVVPYKCGINGCVKNFKEKRSLKRHQQSIHKHEI
ncbi:unnamed protein product [Oppiella nova]|uniref:C2H2-type domain-containing protein n=1 Tax=Oppiella nova TaxID=334625 RepID=A0A7R9M987_9ACAR|nr:unnamed protein product [Oppiella nova]CAG2173165.1 unnamed protein product [Oppiella nova]